MPLYIFIVAVLNLGLGFAGAVYLGRRYVAMTGADYQPDDDLPIDQSDPSDFSFVEDMVADTDSVADEQPAEEPATEEPPETNAETDEPSPEPNAPESSADEPAIEQFQGEVERFGDRLQQADDQLRASNEDPDAAAIEACLADLKESTDEYLSGRGKAYGSFQEAHTDQPEFVGINDDVQAAVEQQDAQIEEVRAAFDALDCQSDPGDACRSALSETSKLIDGNHGLRDSLDRAAVGGARTEQRLEEMSAEQRVDPLTGICNRAGLEATLTEGLKTDGDRSAELSVALIDLDHFAQINEQHGHKIGDRILQEVAKVFEAEGGDKGTVARYSGQRFIFVLRDADARAATDAIERVRQIMEVTHFHLNEHDITLTITGAVTAVTADDTVDSLVGRSDSTLQEARRYGRNRTFLNDGKFPTPVVPPTLSLEENSITL